MADDEQLPSNFDTDADLAAAIGQMSHEQGLGHEQGWEGLEPIPPGKISEKHSI